MVSLQMEPHVRCARCIFKYLETELAYHFIPLFLVFLHKLAIFCRESKTPNLADSALKRKQLAFVRGHLCARNDVVSALSHVAYRLFFIFITPVIAGSRNETSGLPGEKKMAETYETVCHRRSWETLWSNGIRKRLIDYL